jgi:hypothetical protein
MTSVAKIGLNRIKRADFASLVQGLRDIGSMVPDTVYPAVGAAAGAGSGPLSFGNLANYGAYAATGALPTPLQKHFLPIALKAVNSTVVPLERGGTNAASYALKRLASGASNTRAGVGGFAKAIMTTPAIRMLIRRMWRR